MFGFLMYHAERDTTIFPFLGSQDSTFVIQSVGFTRSRSHRKFKKAQPMTMRRDERFCTCIEYVQRYVGRVQPRYTYVSSIQ